MYAIKHSSAVTSESLYIISKLNKPDTGFALLEFSFSKLDEKVSETVVDQLVQQTKNLKTLRISGADDLPETDRLNVLDLSSRLIEA